MEKKKTLKWLSKFGQPGHIKKNCKNLKVGWIDYVQKFKEEHDFSEKLYGNWIKILDLNQVRKKSKEDSTLRVLENREKAKTKIKKKHVIQKKKAQALREEKLPVERKRETQPSKVLKTRKTWTNYQTKKKSHSSRKQGTKTHKSWQLPIKLK